MIAHFLKYRKKAMAYFGKHVEYSAFVHVLGGIGFGILVSPFTLPHPVRWAIALLVVSLIGHLYTLSAKK